MKSVIAVSVRQQGSLVKTVLAHPGVTTDDLDAHYERVSKLIDDVIGHQAGVETRLGLEFWEMLQKEQKEMKKMMLAFQEGICNTIKKEFAKMAPSHKKPLDNFLIDLDGDIENAEKALEQSRSLKRKHEGGRDESGPMPGKQRRFSITKQKYM